LYGAVVITGCLHAERRRFKYLRGKQQRQGTYMLYIFVMHDKGLVIQDEIAV